MKKIFILLGILLLLGCTNTMNTPTSKVENFLSKYQNLDKNVLTDIDRYLDKNKSLSKNDKKIYKEVLQRQYQNLSYKIKNEEIDRTVSIIDVEIEVLDYRNKKIKELKTVEDRIKYDITFYLNKENGLWTLENLSRDDYLKINGLY